MNGSDYMKTMLALLFVLFLLPATGAAQTEVDLMSVGRSLPLVTRAELEESLSWHQAVVELLAGAKLSAPR